MTAAGDAPLRAEVPLAPMRPGLAMELRGALAIAYREWLFARRFIVESVGGALFSTALYLLVFTVALGGGMAADAGSVLKHIAPGLIAVFGLQMVAQMTGASVLISKHEHSISTLLMAPLSPAALLGGYLIGGVSMGLVTGIGVSIVASLFVVPHPDFWVLGLFLVLGAFMLSALGVLVGLWAQRWDQFSFIMDIIISPMMMLSGTFVSVSALPGQWQALAYLSPLTYLISGLRHGYTGEAELPLALTAGVSAGVAVFLVSLAMLLVARGWRLKD